MTQNIYVIGARMNRRDLLKSLCAVPFLSAFKIERKKKLKKGFKYLEEGAYTYNLPSWKDKEGRCYLMYSEHSTPLTLEEADDPKTVGFYRLETAKKSRDRKQFFENKDLVVVMYEKTYQGKDVDKNNGFLFVPEESHLYNKVYNATRYFLIDRKKFEAEVWI